MYYITKIIKWECAHRLLNHEGACFNIHGHSYKAHITLKGETLNKKSNMIMDFKDLKNILNTHIISKWDHAALISSYDGNFIKLCETEKYKHEIINEENISAEWMSKYIYDVLKANLYVNYSDKVLVDSVTVYETDTSYATYKES